jgi:glycosyltransferase involved in cell wall biosynthesis
VVTIHDLHFLAHPDRTSGEIRRDYPNLAARHAHRADRVIVVSRFVKGEVQRVFGIPGEKISVCPNGAPEWTSAPAVPNPDGYLLFLGTLEPRKNVGGLLAAYGQMISRAPHAPRLVIAGGLDPGAADPLAPARQPPLAGRVEYRGYVNPDDRESLFKGAMAFVLPSFDEGFGIPALEAMAAGVPVIASNRGALPEIVGDAGLLVDPADPENLTAAMLQLTGDAHLRAACAQRGLERARQFSWTQTGRSVRRAYEDAILSHRHRTAALAGQGHTVHSRNAHRH